MGCVLGGLLLGMVLVGFLIFVSRNRKKEKIIFNVAEPSETENDI